MPEISRITLPSGTTYDIKDTIARQSASGGITLRGTTTTALTDECTTNPITINGNSYTAVNQDAVFYGKKEFVFDGTMWHEFGDMSGLGALATKDAATGSFTPSGTVSQPTFTGSASAIEITASASESGNYTPAGSVSAPTISVASAGATTSIQPVSSVGSMPTYSVSGETLTISAGSVPTLGTAVSVKTGDASYTASAPSFTGTKVELSGTATASGTVSQPEFTGTAGTVTVS